MAKSIEAPSEESNGLSKEPNKAWDFVKIKLIKKKLIKVLSKILN